MKNFSISKYTSWAFLLIKHECVNMNVRSHGQVLVSRKSSNLIGSGIHENEHSCLIQRKAQDIYFEMEKFFTPTKVFYPPFYWCIPIIKRGISIWSLDIDLTLEGVKNFWGVKNFSLFDRVDFQVLPEEKIKWIAWKLIIMCGKEIR